MATIVYTYRPANASDINSAHYVNSGNDIVITGVSEISSNGEYQVPAYIDGKRVLAIMPNAFCGTNAKKVVVGASCANVPPSIRMTVTNPPNGCPKHSETER